MALTRRSVETLMDLVEIKLSAMQIFDREDAREHAALEKCRAELSALMRPQPRLPGDPLRPARRMVTH